MVCGSFVWRPLWIDYTCSGKGPFCLWHVSVFAGQCCSDYYELCSNANQSCQWLLISSLSCSCDCDELTGTLFGKVAVGIVKESRKFFRAPIHGAHCAVIFAIAQVSCFLGTGTIFQHCPYSGRHPRAYDRWHRCFCLTVHLRGWKIEVNWKGMIGCWPITTHILTLIPTARISN